LAYTTSVRPYSPLTTLIIQLTDVVNRGVKKPLNPILGEIFTCYWDLPDDTRAYYISLEEGGDATENWLRAERELVTA